MTEKKVFLPELPERLQGLSEFLERADQLGGEDSDTESMLKYRMKAPYSDAPVAKPIKWQTEFIA